MTTDNFLIRDSCLCLGYFQLLFFYFRNWSRELTTFITQFLTMAHIYHPVSLLAESTAVQQEADKSVF